MFSREVTDILSRLEAAGHSAYAVGGCVRDLLRGGEPHDVDIATSARPEEVMALFAPRAIPTGLQHGTVTVRENHQSFEVTTFRADGPYSDGRRPDSVAFSDNLHEDLRRRDFTVNAMAMDLRGDLHDPYGGREDLERKVIRCVGDAEKRFGEDALRIMRALRFASTLGFTIEGDTARAMTACAPRLQMIAAERIHEEMTKLLCGDGAAEVLLAWPRVLRVFLPEILPCVGFDQRNRHHCYDVWEHTARAVAAAPKDALLRWAMLLHDIAKPEKFTVDEKGVGHFYGHDVRGTELARDIMRRLRFDKRSAARIELLVLWHDRDIARTEKAIGKALNAIGEEALRQLIAVKRADNMAQHPDFRVVQQELDKAETILAAVLEKEQCFSIKHLAVNGRALMELGLRGAEIGQTLEELLEQVVEGALPNEKEALLGWVQSRR